MRIPARCVPRVTFNPVRSELLFANNAWFLHTCIECAVNYDRVCARAHLCCACDRASTPVDADERTKSGRAACRRVIESLLIGFE